MRTIRWIVRVCSACLLLSAALPLVADVAQEGPAFVVGTRTFYVNDPDGYSPGYIGFVPKVAMSALGSFIVVWSTPSQALGHLVQTKAVRFNRSGRPVDGERLVRSADRYQLKPGVAVDGSGNAVFAWTTGAHVRSRRMSKRGQFAGRDFLVDADPWYSTFDATVSASGSGAFSFAWNESFPAGTQVRARRFDETGSALGTDILVTEDGDPLVPPVIAMDGSGRMVVVYSKLDGSHNLGVFGSVYDDQGVRVGPEFQVNEYAAGSESDPDVAMDELGNFVVVWHGEGQDADGGVQARCFDGSGSPIGSEFLVNAETVGRQFSAAVAMSPEGNFLVTWSGPTQVGSSNSASGILLRRFSATGSPMGGDAVIAAQDQAFGSPDVAMSGSGELRRRLEEHLAQAHRLPTPGDREHLRPGRVRSSAPAMTP